MLPSFVKRRLNLMAVEVSFESHPLVLEVPFGKASLWLFQMNFQFIFWSM
jgi:hypothetical protein